MKVRITPRGITILGEEEVRVRGVVTDVEIKLTNGSEIRLSLDEDIKGHVLHLEHYS